MLHAFCHLLIFLKNNIHNKKDQKYMHDSRWGTGDPDPLENSQKIGLLSNIDPDLLKTYNGANGTPFAGGPMMARLKWFLDLLFLYQVKPAWKYHQSVKETGSRSGPTKCRLKAISTIQ